MYDLLALNDDVLLLIFSFIDGIDALNLSLCSKRTYDLAAPRITANLECSSPERLRLLHANLHKTFEDGIRRVRHLEKLAIHCATFEGPPDDESDDDGLDIFFGTNFSQASLIGDILLDAANLGQLSLDRVQPCIAQDPRIGVALCALQGLINVRLSTVGDKTLAIMQCMKSTSLERLTLSYHTYDDYPIDDVISLPPLVGALANFRALHTLKLWNFRPSDTLFKDPSYQPPSLPSVRNLRLSSSSVCGLDLVQLCPNLSTLIYSLDLENQQDVSAYAGPQIKPLSRLMLQDPAEVVCLAKCIGRVDQLQLAGTYQPEELLSADSSLLEFVTKTSPTGLYLSIRFSAVASLESASFWRELSHRAPRLRSLEVKLVRQPRPLNDSFEWLVGFTKTLTSLPLQCLRIFVSANQRSIYRDLADQIEVQRLYMELERRRVQALNVLPTFLFEALPTLRYAAVGDAKANLPVLEDPERIWDNSTGLSHWPADGRLEWDELRCVEYIGGQRWLKVVDEDGHRTLVEIQEEEGELAQRIIEIGK